MKPAFHLIIILFLSTQVLAQRIKVFYDQDGKACDSMSSKYYRLERNRKEITFHNNKPNSDIDTVLSYYSATGKLRTREIYKGKLLNGVYNSYHENGRISMKGAYYQDRKVGYFTNWYPEGHVQQTVQYVIKPQADVSKLFNPTLDLPENEPVIINYWDSLGRQLVKNGTGICRCFRDAGGGYIRTDGKLVNGVKDSVWMEYTNDSLSYRETFNNGKLLEGVRYSRHDEYLYHEFDQRPEFPGGLEAMIRFIQQNLRYPSEAQRRGIEGKVFVGFVVKKDGSVSKVEIVDGIFHDCDAEAIRVVKMMKKWTPGRMRGALVNVKYILPINFKLRDR